MDQLKSCIRDTKVRLLRMHLDSGSGHIGCNLSCLDILMTVFHMEMQDGDEFILSKGHAAGALYATLWSLGHLTDDDLRTFQKDGTKLAGHPSPNHLPNIPFATGSLGHGLPVACGMALGKQLRGEPGRIYCLLSDGEWQEGSNWEALIFAARRNLNITIIVDKNGLQGFGATRDMVGSDDFVQQFKAFGIPAREAPGHDVSALHGALSDCKIGTQAIIAVTHKGSGISFMEDQLDWHYLRLNESLYQQAVEEIMAR